MPDYKTDTFRALLNAEKGLASGNKFQVRLPSIGGTPKPGGGAASDVGTSQDDRNLLCTAVGMPGKSILTTDRLIGAEIKRVATGFAPGDVSLTFYLTNLYTMKKWFTEWQECVVQRKEPYHVGYFDNYTKDVEIIQLDKKHQKVYGLKLLNAYPTNIAEITLNNQLDNAPLELTVTLSYVNFEVI